MPAKIPRQAPRISAFISHAKADAKKAQEIAASLEERGLSCWIAPRDVKAGRAYGDEIIRGIESAQNFVLVLSKASNDSAFVAREVERAVSKKKPIFAVRVANIEPAPSLELFISGTQWIDAFPGRLQPHIDRLADLLAEEEGREPAKAAAETTAVEPRRVPRWAWPAGALSALLLAGVVGLFVWQGQGQKSESTDPNLLIKPVWLDKQEHKTEQQVATAESGDTEMIVSGKPQISSEDVFMDSFKETEEQKAFFDPNFTACEKSSGNDAIAACDRAIASGKYSWRTLSYLYSDRGFMLMQKGAIEAALVDLNKAIEIDSTNFYGFWSRGAVYAAKRDFEGARADFTTALALNPDETSKAKIEEALNAASAGAKAASAQTSDPSVISDPTVFGGDQEGSASAAASYPADAASPYDDTGPLPAEPPMAAEPVPDR